MTTLNLSFLPAAARPLTLDDYNIICDISIRARKELNLNRIDTEMDLIAVHTCDSPLDLKKLLDADDFNFSHDVLGIANCLDREQCKLTRHFSPRCTAPSASA